MIDNFIIRNFLLQPLLWDINNLKLTLSHLSFAHVYRDINIEVDMISKEGLCLQEGT
jgi:hypothetical protein